MTCMVGNCCSLHGMGVRGRCQQQLVTPIKLNWLWLTWWSPRSNLGNLVWHICLQFSCTAIVTCTPSKFNFAATPCLDPHHSTSLRMLHKHALQWQQNCGHCDWHFCEECWKHVCQLWNQWQWDWKHLRPISWQFAGHKQMLSFFLFKMKTSSMVLCRLHDFEISSLSGQQEKGWHCGGECWAVPTLVDCWFFNSDWIVPSSFISHMISCLALLPQVSAAHTQRGLSLCVFVSTGHESMKIAIVKSKRKQSKHKRNSFCERWEINDGAVSIFQSAVHHIVHGMESPHVGLTTHGVGAPQCHMTSCC